jgi:hypothetical protein
MKLQNWARHFVWGGGGKSTAYLYIYTHLSDSNLDVIEKISELHRRKYNLDESRQESLTLCQTGF